MTMQIMNLNELNKAFGVQKELFDMDIKEFIKKIIDLEVKGFVDFNLTTDGGFELHFGNQYTKTEVYYKVGVIECNGIEFYGVKCGSYNLLFWSEDGNNFRLAQTVRDSFDSVKGEFFLRKNDHGNFEEQINLTHIGVYLEMFKIR